MSRVLAFVAVSALSIPALASPNARIVVPTPPSRDFQSPPPVRLEAYVVMQEPTSQAQAKEPVKAAPAPAAAPPAPVAPPPAAQASAPTAPPPPSVVEPSNVGRGWTYYRDRDGSYFRMRRSGVTKPAIWGTGLALVVASWAASIPFNGYAPIMGGFIAATSKSGSDSTTAGLMLFDGIVGVGGAVMVIVGVALGKEHIERQPVAVTPLAFRDGAGAGLSVRF